MNVLAWTLQVVCATTFLASGTMKSLMSKQRMIATGQTGVAPFPLPLLRVVALAELAGVLGLLLPWATGTGRTERRDAGPVVHPGRDLRGPRRHQSLRPRRFVTPETPQPCVL
jgi:hypothetical protein